MKKKIVNRLLSVMLTVIMLTGLFSFNGFAMQGVTPNEFSDGLFYAKNAISQVSGSEGILYAYNKIAEGVQSGTTYIDIYDEAHPITGEQLSIAFEAFINDNPQFFWIEKTYSIYARSDTGSAVAIELQYSLSGDELENAKTAFEQSANRILNDIPLSLGEYETELAIHDKLAANTEYVLDAANAHSAYGALVDGQAVCEGYAKALQYLLYCRGIQSLMVTGDAYSDGSTAVAHAWNLVRINGNYYYTDLTFDDSESYVYHNYFNITTEKLIQDRTIDETYYALPECTATDDFYFNKNGTTMSAPYSAETVGKLIAASGGTADIYVEDGGDLGTWFSQNIGDICTAAGITGNVKISYSYACNGDEWLLGLYAVVSVSGNVISSDTLDCTVKLYSASAEDSLIYADINSNTYANAVDAQISLGSAALSGGKYVQSFSVSDIYTGNYKLVAVKDGYVASITPVTVTASSADLGSVTLLQYGDANNDGAVNSADALAVKQCLIGQADLGDSSITASDINKNGVIDSADYLTIYQYVLGLAKIA
jgi:hypothetical protein